MAEVVDWAPIDDDNDAAPPVGAPEGMMPSAVNNTLRAMMASLRRMYDKIVDGSLALPYVPTAGGVITGNLAVNGTGGVALSSTQLRHISSGLEVYNAGGGGVLSRGPVSGYAYADRDQISPGWTWYANSGLSYLHSQATGNVLNVTNIGAMSVATSVDTPAHKIQGTIFAERADNGHLIYDADGQPALALYGAAGGQTSLYRADTHQFENNAGTETVEINSAGRLSAGSASITGTAQAGQLVSNGNVTAAGGSFIGAACSISNGLFANLDATDIDCVGNIDAASYTRSGVPVFLMTLAEHGEILTRIEALETQMTQLRGMADV